jgi:hypothetical protein
MSLLNLDLSPLGEALLIWLDGDEDEMDDVLADAKWAPSLPEEG